MKSFKNSNELPKNKKIIGSKMIVVDNDHISDDTL